jgi:hypothetical protein
MRTCACRRNPAQLRAMDAMMKMKKIDIAAIERAAEGAKAAA